jgi:hypothetical protein
MRGLLNRSALVCIAILTSGCVSEATRRADGLTDGAGNSMAANSVMQMVDPWQDGVQDTRLLIPAARGAQPSLADDAAAAKDSQSTTN